MNKQEFIWLGNSGCLLPFLIIFNLFFGRFILGSTLLWLGLELSLVLIFILKVNIIARKLNRLNPQNKHRPQNRVIDVQGQVVEEDKKPK